MQTIVQKWVEVLLALPVTAKCERYGQHVMHMQWMDAPDSLIEALSGVESEHQGDEQEDSHGEEYDLETFRQAVLLGQHPDGDTLGHDMPVWRSNRGKNFGMGGIFKMVVARVNRKEDTIEA